ncbi:MAG: SEC-C metal-binding domain-containing protein [Thermoleophilaceae bacterium]
MDACQGVLDFVRHTMDNWGTLGGRPPEPDADILILTIFARSTRTYEAVVKHLGNKGFGEQGAMLNRSLFEDMVDAHWVSLNPELAVERMDQHDRWSQVLRARVHRQFPEFLGDDDPPVKEPSDEEDKLYRQLFGAWGSGSWTGVNMHERVKEIEPCWTEELGRRHLRFVHAWAHRLHNETLHLSAYSLGRVSNAPKLTDEGAPHFTFGASAAMLTETLFSAFWAYSQTFSLVYDTFELDVGRRFDEEHRRKVMREFLPLSEEQLKGVGRNDPCPCGSGLKYKKCHAAV